MARRQYVVTYDISDDRRRDKVYKTLHGFGDHAQFSVFFCELTDEEVTRLRVRLHGLIHHGEDQVLIVELGPAIRPLATALQVVGRAYTPSIRTLVV
ncbi:MAG: CRISPR-associated endonuclease Cas2 [Gemmatimonadota bacterium]